MDFTPVYLVHHFFTRFLDFFHHWYVHGSRRFAHAFISLLEQLDEYFAVKITLLHFFEPLYKDYSVIGRILGIVFRSARILFGSAVYATAGVVVGALYLLWLLIPPVILFEVVTTFPRSVLHTP